MNVKCASRQTKKASHQKNVIISVSIFCTLELDIILNKNMIVERTICNIAHKLTH